MRDIYRILRDYVLPRLVLFIYGMLLAAMIVYLLWLKLH